MVERICPVCQQGNPVNDRFCGKCGAAMERQLPARRGETQLTLAGRNLPVTWQQLGKTVALSVAAVAAEAGLAWLRHRIESGPSAPLARTLSNTPKETTELSRPAGSIVTIISQRVVEIWDSGDGHKKINEHHTWRRIEE